MLADALTPRRGRGLVPRPSWFAADAAACARLQRADLRRTRRARATQLHEAARAQEHSQARTVAAARACCARQRCCLRPESRPEFAAARARVGSLRRWLGHGRPRCRQCRRRRWAG